MWEEPRYAVVCLKEGELEWLCETSWVVSAQTGRRMEGSRKLICKHQLENTCVIWDYDLTS